MSESFSFSPTEGTQISFIGLNVKVQGGQVIISRCEQPVEPVEPVEPDESQPEGGHPNAKLTPIQVEAIRRQYAAGFDKKTLADAYGVSLANIHSIIKGLTWRHVGGPISD